MGGHLQALLDLENSLDTRGPKSLRFRHSLIFGPDPRRLDVDTLIYLRDLNDAGSTDDLFRLFESKLKLVEPLDVGYGEFQIRQGLRRLRAQIHHYDSVHDDEFSSALENLLDSVRNFGSQVSEFLRYESRRMKRELLYVTALTSLESDSRRSLDDLVQSVNILAALMKEIESLYLSKAGFESPVMQLLKKFIGRIYREMLSGLLLEMQNYPAKSVGPELYGAWTELYNIIKDRSDFEEKKHRDSADSDDFAKLKAFFRARTTTDIQMRSKDILPNAFPAWARKFFFGVPNGTKPLIKRRLELRAGKGIGTLSERIFINTGLALDFNGSSRSCSMVRLSQTIELAAHCNNYGLFERSVQHEVQVATEVLHAASNSRVIDTGL